MPDQMEPNIQASFISHLRNSLRVTCPVPGCGKAFPTIDDRIRGHLQIKHYSSIKGEDLNSLIRDIENRR